MRHCFFLIDRRHGDHPLPPPSQSRAPLLEVMEVCGIYIALSVKDRAPWFATRLGKLQYLHN